MEVMIAVQSGTHFFTNNEQRNYNKQRTPTTTRTPRSRVDKNKYYLYMQIFVAK
jgi:hypothetical protein